MDFLGAKLAEAPIDAGSETHSVSMAVRICRYRLRVMEVAAARAGTAPPMPDLTGSQSVGEKRGAGHSAGASRPAPNSQRATETR